MQNGVTLAERAALDILAGQPDTKAFHREGGEGEGFGGSPVERAFASAHLAPGIQQALDASVGLKVVGNASEFFKERRETVALDGGLDIFLGLGAAFVATPESRESVIAVNKVSAACGRELFFEMRAPFFGYAIGFFPTHALEGQ